MKELCVIFFFLISTTILWSQGKFSAYDIKPDKEFENVLVKKIFTDPHTSTFVIWIKNEVKPHQHLKHTEQVFILEGKANVWLNKEEIVVQAGDWITIPEKTIHAVKVISETPLKVISIQTPEFKGKDRVFIE
ncbi:MULTISPECIES: cupin domain-containing protein [Aquimarina]|uniref:Cupin domain-containing protein n=1 Tax=Aquimarina algiphila TaxID=2047982 RepID=A0A554VRX6_9FLAO|nr:MULTISPECIES: cupin domain-containing protein [Aquimarina]TSE11427.1 cupin domain-containing protein [Aquimarina algiphila]